MAGWNDDRYGPVGPKRVHLMNCMVVLMLLIVVLVMAFEPQIRAFVQSLQGGS